jgi:hypothetical protein
VSLPHDLHSCINAAPLATSQINKRIAVGWMAVMRFQELADCIVE